MKCNRPLFLRSSLDATKECPEQGPELPDSLTDYLTGREIPFTNRDYIRQKILKFLVEDKGYLKEDISVEREIRFDLEGQAVCSPVDISITLQKRTLMIWKCASGSLVSRERQVLASARLLETHIVPLVAVTNGRDVELLNAHDGKMIAASFLEIPSRRELSALAQDFPEKTMKAGKVINEQRILYTYDAISCPSGSIPR